MSDHTERGIHADRDHSEEPPRADHGPFCPAFSAPRIGRFRAIETEGPCTCKPFWPAGYAQRVRTAAQGATGHTETGEALRGAEDGEERWWTDEDAAQLDAAIGEHIGRHGDAFDPHEWRCYDKERYPGDCGCKAYLRDDALAALAPTVERIRREAKAEALREFAGVIETLAGYAEKAGDGYGGGLLKAMARDMRNRADRIEAGDA